MCRTHLSDTDPELEFRLVEHHVSVLDDERHSCEQRQRGKTVTKSWTLCVMDQPRTQKKNHRRTFHESATKQQQQALHSPFFLCFRSYCPARLRQTNLTTRYLLHKVPKKKVFYGSLRLFFGDTTDTNFNHVCGARAAAAVAGSDKPNVSLWLERYVDQEQHR